MWTYKLSDDGESYSHRRYYDLDAVKEWLSAAIHTRRGELPYLPSTYGIDLIQVSCSTNPKHYLEESLKELCKLRNDVNFVSCNCWVKDRTLFATAEFSTIYGDVKIINTPITTISQ